MSARDDLIYRITRHCSDETAQKMVDAHRAEVVADLVDRCATALANCCSECDAAIAIVRSRGERLLENAPVPERNLTTAAIHDFFQVGHTYAREHHGRTIEFHVRHVDTAPDCDFPTAFGFRKDPEIDVMLPMGADDFHGCGWTDVTEAGDR